MVKALDEIDKVMDDDITCQNKLRVQIEGRAFDE